MITFIKYVILMGDCKMREKRIIAIVVLVAALASFAYIISFRWFEVAPIESVVAFEERLQSHFPNASLVNAKLFNTGLGVEVSTKNDKDQITDQSYYGYCLFIDPSDAEQRVFLVYKKYITKRSFMVSPDLYDVSDVWGQIKKRSSDDEAALKEIISEYELDPTMIVDGVFKEAPGIINLAWASVVVLGVVSLVAIIMILIASVKIKKEDAEFVLDDEDDDTPWYSSENMLQFEHENCVSPAQIKSLCYGAVLMTQNQESSRTLKLEGRSPESARKSISSMWSINNREDALHTLQILVECVCHTDFADPIYTNIINRVSVEDAMLSANPRARGDVKGAYARYPLTLSGLMDKFGYTENELRSITTVSAWDLGRTCYIARFSLLAGFINEEEAWGYIQQAGYNAVGMYNSWREYFAAYAIGRAIGYGGDLDDIADSIDFLLNNQSSPIKGIAFN